MAVIGRLSGVDVIGIVMGVYGNRHMIAVSIVYIQLLQLGYDVFGQLV